MTKDYDLNLWKFLNPYGATEHLGVETIYPLPQSGEKWGPWFRHPTAQENEDGHDCGPNGWHGMKRIDARYAPRNWWPWYCQTLGIIGQSNEKARVREIRLRRVNKRTFWRMIRLGWCKGANLTDADLTDADLTDADLTDADLTDADLRGADLTRAVLTRAVLTRSDLTDAVLTRSDLRGADLTRAVLTRSDLRDVIIDQYTALSDDQRALFEAANDKTG